MMSVKNHKVGHGTLVAVYDKSNSESGIQTCLDFARLKFGVPDPLVFNEGVKPGANDIPEGLSALLAEVRKGAEKTIIVANIEALSRDMHTLAKTQSIIDRCGAELYLASGQRVDQVVALIGAHHDAERLTRSARIKAGMAAATARRRTA
jgi:DNA invertase Pin-like site-specific DNA recombinase